MTDYHTAQICKNGHVITAYYQSANDGQPYCDQCGEETMTECKNCDAKIRGDAEGGFPEFDYTAPKYCYQCGNPFTWTQRSIKAAEELAEELEGLNSKEKETLKSSISSLTKEGPQTQLAQNRFKRIMSKVGRESAEAMKSILVDIISETVKKSIYGQ